ncbi:AAA-like domain-containing protein [Fischerella thermalis]|uniref:AAA-like domain-containing protein n=1 Tax=Fischerella thermalis TaxID=372787 RepID=UPI0019F83BD7|nr:AAA-like domain-containing protein [Fischerella thermalis]MBF1990103.1 AAA-like domain-containing protein [Fischerella thermalis M58_A2018_009]MBF2062543.1 AAA-like domain-containing protein [Fischerella thermalis M66_A2018_004]MBF2068649.1 AAA-like domain-containing protein [Fischerella thermalis M48_A2018_028]
MAENIQEQAITFETALKVADESVFAKHKRHLKNIEVAVLRGALQGQKYDQIATEYDYAPEYIKHDVGPKLWQILSSSLGEKVSKTNLMAVLAHRASEEFKIEDYSSFSSPQSLVSNPQSLELESPVGLIPLDSALYVERPPVESRCYEEITRSGALIRIKAPSQMGKTSLMVRILAHAKQQNPTEVRTVALSLQRAERCIFNDLDKFLRWFCASITRKLQLPHKVEDYWSETFGSKSNCTAYFEDCLLPDINGALVLALDQVEEVFLHPEIADDFFTLLRSWYEEAAYGDSGNPLWQNLRLVIVHSTEVYIPLDINKSPFNVGLAIELQTFTYQQVFNLSQLYRINLSEAELSELMQIVDGHPYLIQQALYHLAQQDLTLKQLIQTAATDAGIYSNHLHRHLRSLQEHPQLAAAYEEVINSSNPVELEQILAFKLHSMGLVKLQGNQVISSCELYRQYFEEALRPNAIRN